MQITLGNFVFRPDWKTSVLTIVLLPLLLSLSNWQFKREQEKIAILDAYSARQQQGAKDLGSNWEALAGLPDPRYIVVKASGQFLPGQLAFLDNKTRGGKVGYEVLQEFQLNTEASAPTHSVWVNRGWVAGMRLRSEAPKVEQVSGPIQIQAMIYQPFGEAFMLGENESSLGKEAYLLLQSLNLPALTARAKSSIVFPATLRLGEQSPAALDTHWQAVNTRPEKHRAYAFQWLAMAIALVVFYVLRSTERRLNATN